MKLNYIFTTILALLAIPTWAGDVVINETNFPDANFRNYLLKQDYGQDGILTEEEISKITSIEVSYKQISSLQGIEFFTALTSLYCNRNQLTSLDVSHNTALTYLKCSSNQLTSLDVSQNTALEKLYCSFNQLTSLDVSGATALKGLSCYSNQIKGTEMDNLVNSLPINDIENKKFYVYGGENEGNVCTTVQVAVAKSRGWTPWYYYEETEEEGEYAGSDPSGIEDVTIGDIEDAPVYNLSGQRLSAPQKGINIVNGKKVISLRSK